MNIFGGRPGVLAGTLAIIAILAAFYFIKAVAFALIASAVLLLAAVAVLCFCGYIRPYRLFASAFAISVFCISLLRGSFVFNDYMPIVSSFAGEERYVHATVTERRGASDYYAVFVLRLHSIDGIEYGERAILNCEYNAGFQVGYEIVLRGADITPTTALPEAEAYDMLSEKILLSILSENENDSAVLSRNDLSFTDKCRSLNLLCAARLKNSIKGDGGRLAAAMLLGDKGSIPTHIYRDFSRSGLSHYLAVSGLHVSIITGIVSFILTHLRIKRSLRNILLALFAVGYLCLLGFPISAVRSVTMLLTVFIAYSLGDSSDALNALGLAAAGIVTVSPCAVFDKSFILSFCATLGIVVFAPLFNGLIFKLLEKKNEESEFTVRASGGVIVRKAVSFVFGSLMSISAALSLTVLPVMYFFGEVSVLSFRSNLAASVAATPLLASSLFFLAFGEIPYVGDFFKAGVELSSEYMISLAARLSDVRGALVSLVYKESEILIWTFTAIVVFFLMIKLKHKAPLLALPALYPVLLAAFVLISVANRPEKAEFEIVSWQKNETICVIQGSDAAIVDISEGYLSSLRTAYSNANERGVTQIDTLMLTHYHSKHLSSVSRFISEVKVRRLLLPYPQNESDAWIMAQLAEAANSLGVVAEMMPKGAPFELINGISAYHSGINRLERSNSPIFFISFSNGEERLTYISESSWDGEGGFDTELRTFAREADYILIGDQGPVAKTAFDIPINNSKRIFLLGDPLTEHLLDPGSSIYDRINESVIETGVSRKTLVLNE